MCLSEVDRALDAGVEPRLLCLLGHRYGWRPLPPWISPSHLERLERAAAAPAGAALAVEKGAADLVRAWYLLDTNAVPAHLALRSAHDLPQHQWAEVERQLRTTLDAIAANDEWLVENGRSLTEREVRRGLDGHARAFAVLRTVADPIAPATSLRERLFEADPALERAQNRLCDDVRREVPAAHRFEAAIGWEAAVNPQLSAPVYEASLMEKVQQWLSSQVRTSLADYEVRGGQLSVSQLQFVVAEQRAHSFAERWNDLDKLNDAVASPGVAPILLQGRAGSGKSTLVSRMWVDRVARGEQIVGRFAAESGSRDPRGLMQGLLREVLIAAGESPAAPAAESLAIARFRQALAGSAARRPMLLIIDGVDEMVDLAKTLVRWLPGRLPEGLSIVLSVREGTDAEILRTGFGLAQRITLEGLAEANGDALLDRWLSGIRRQLLPEQRSAILTAFARDGTPLWLNIVFEQARSWRSFDEVPPLPASLEGLIGKLVVQRLLDPGRHLPEFSIRALAVIAGSRYGLTETELIGSISADDTFWFAFNSSRRWELPERRIPDALWGRLKADLDPYLAHGRSSSDALVRFKHTAFAESVREALPRAGGIDPHGLLARFFRDQPLYFDVEGRAEPNRRKLAELPYQLIKSGRLDDLIELLVDDPSWRRACAEVDPDDAGFIGDLDLALDALPELPRPSAIRSAVRLAVARWQADLSRLGHTDDDLQLMVRLGLEARALSLAEEREDPETLASALTSIAEAIANIEGVPDSDAISRAEAAAGSLGDPWARIRLLVRLIETRARLGDRNGAADLVERLGALAGATSGDEQRRGTYVIQLVERLTALGEADLALAAAALEPVDGRVLSGPHASGYLARAEASAGALDAALERAAHFEHGTFDYGVMCWHVLSGAARHGTGTLLSAAAAFDLGAIIDRCRFDVALILRDHEEPLRRLLEPVFEPARRLVPELAALERQRADAPRRPFHFPDLKTDKWDPPDDVTLRAGDLDSQIRRLDLVRFSYFAARLHEPWVADLLPLARSLIDLGGEDYRTFYEYAAATAVIRGAEAAIPLFRDAVGISLSAGDRYEHRRSLKARVRMLESVADSYLRASIGTCSRLIGVLVDPHARIAMGLGFLALDRLSPQQRGDVLAGWRADLPQIDSLEHLRAMGRNIHAPGEHDLGGAILRRIEHLLRKERRSDSVRDHVARERLEGIARLDPAAALVRARAGGFGPPAESVTTLATVLAGRRDQDSSAPFVEAARFAREHGDPLFLRGCEVLQRLLLLGELEEALLLSKSLLVPEAIDRVSRALEVIRAFGLAGASRALTRAFDETPIQAHVAWLLGTVQRSEVEPGPRHLTPEELHYLEESSSTRDLSEVGLTALDLNLPAGAQLVTAAIEKAASTSDEAAGGDGLRSLGLRDLVLLLCRRGAAPRAAQALSRMHWSGGDGHNHEDWALALGDVGAAYCESGELTAAFRLIERLNLHDADERSAASVVRQAAARALAGAGDLSAAEEQIALIPDARVRRAASAVVVHYYARRGEYRSALRHIAQSTMSQNIHLCVEVVNLLVEQKCIDTLEDYDAIVDAIAANESAAAPGAA